jgi:hypothetical protein
MSTIVWIFTVVVLSPQKIVMLAERVDYENQAAHDIREYNFENSEAGFREIEKTMDKIKKKNNDPGTDCVFNLNNENKGFIRVGMFPKSIFKDHKSPESQTPRQLSEFCRKKKTGL